ncbi:hypothetical protein [Neptuniibacter sp. QD48_11]|uniref:hypothetical protein n=1 Tax=Neptuniibacter sp. QD48_11 TaxID=3398211 RepID=UPI0039F485B7
MSLDQELKEIEQQCNCPPNTDIIAGWNAAKDGNYTPPYNFTRERSRDWVKGNKAYRCRMLSLPENLTEKEAYQAGYQSYFSNNGQLINPCKGRGELEHAFEDGWGQALRKQSSPKFDKSKYQDNGPKTFSEKYSKRDDGYQPSKPKINLYKLMRDGE